MILNVLNKKWKDNSTLFLQSNAYKFIVISYKKNGVYFNEKCIKNFPENKYLRRLSHLLSFAEINNEIINSKYDFRCTLTNLR